MVLGSMVSFLTILAHAGGDRDVPAPANEKVFKKCQLIKKEVLAESRDRGEPIVKLVFAAPGKELVDVNTALRQVILVRANGVTRKYSPPSEPCRPDGTFELIVRVYESGNVSRFLGSLQVGETADMCWPFPSPLIPDRRNAGTHVGLVAYGVGITELFRVAINELGDPAVQEVLLLYSTRTAEDQQVLGRELEELALKEKRFRLLRAVSRERVPGMLHGRADASMLREVFLPWATGPDRSNARFLPAGSKDMILLAHKCLVDLGFDADQSKLIRDNRPLASS
ncbi:CBR1 [Symbiodinium sp. CCMP2592]|nr:CBR1 [Symbiodinium sp. CCMP2592]